MYWVITQLRVLSLLCLTEFEEISDSPWKSDPVSSDAISGVPQEWMPAFCKGKHLGKTWGFSTKGFYIQHTMGLICLTEIWVIQERPLICWGHRKWAKLSERRENQVETAEEHSQDRIAMKWRGGWEVISQSSLKHSGSEPLRGLPSWAVFLSDTT